MTPEECAELQSKIRPIQERIAIDLYNEYEGRQPGKVTPWENADRQSRKHWMWVAWDKVIENIQFDGWIFG